MALPVAEVAETEEAEEAEVDREAGEAGILSVTVEVRVRRDFCLFFFFISLKVFLRGSNPSSTVCFRLGASVLEGSVL